MSVDSKTWGIDIGGAHLKLCRPDGVCTVKPFPMWVEYERLGIAIAELIEQSSHPRDEEGVTFCDESVLAVTMTGEMADCFPTRREGVARILDQLMVILPEEQCRIYAVGGDWMSVIQAKENAWRVAASNWHALAFWALNQANWNPKNWCAVLDIGSTTVDIVPIKNGAIHTQARTDRERLQLGQLVYTGMERTPVHAIVRSLWVGNRKCPVVAERFATAADANLILETLSEDPNNWDTADGRPSTRQFALSRLARMIGEDAERLSEAELVSMARQIVDSQARKIRAALIHNLKSVIQLQCDKSPDWLGQPATVLVSGHGKALVDRIRQHRSLNGIQFDFLEYHGCSMAARCAPAVAVAWLWDHRNLVGGST